MFKNHGFTQDVTAYETADLRILVTGKFNELLPKAYHHTSQNIMPLLAHNL